MASNERLLMSRAWVVLLIVGLTLGRPPLVLSAQGAMVPVQPGEEVRLQLPESTITGSVALVDSDSLVVALRKQEGRLVVYRDEARAGYYAVSPPAHASPVRVISLEVGRGMRGVGTIGGAAWGAVLGGITVMTIAAAISGGDTDAEGFLVYSIPTIPLAGAIAGGILGRRVRANYWKDIP